MNKPGDDCLVVGVGRGEELRMNTDDGRSGDEEHQRVVAGVVRCPVCGDVIGVYEPICVVRAGSVRKSSLAREPVLGSGEEAIMHFACCSDLGVGRGEDGGASTTGVDDRGHSPKV